MCSPSHAIAWENGELLTLDFDDKVAHVIGTSAVHRLHDQLDTPDVERVKGVAKTLIFSL